MKMSEIIKNRYDFVYLFDVKDGNPNGDPDAGNLPRVDPETGHGLVTDVCLKRKVRNYVIAYPPNAEGYDIFIKEKAILNVLINEAHEQKQVKAKEKSEKTDEARKFMCQKYYDVRAFGAVMSTGKNAGQVRGPVQITFSRSVDAVSTLEHSITRMAVATEAEAEKQSGETRTMGRKFTVPYALYRCHGFVSASLAEQTGFSEADLSLFWQALKSMFEHDRSAARGQMEARKLIVFKHDGKLGNAPAHELFDRVNVTRKEGPLPPRDFSDYKVKVDAENMPAGVQLIDMIISS
jgi:CRISPR-associated protein Csd2